MAITHRSRTLLSLTDAPNFTAPLIGGSRTENKSERTWPNGTGDGQADVVYDKGHVIAAGGTLTLDLATGGGLEQADGSAVAMVRLKALMVRKTDGDGSFSVEIPASGILHLAAVGDKTQTFATDDDCYIFVSYNGAIVTGGSADEILINEEGGAETVTIQVTAIGDSA